MPTFKHGLERHRGACSISEAPTPRRKFAGRRKPPPSGLDAVRLKDHLADLEAFALFQANLDCIALKSPELSLETLKTLHRAYLPVAYPRRTDP